MIAVLLALGASFGAVALACHVERRLLQNEVSFRMVVATALLGLAVWLLTLISTTYVLRVPGGAGPIQYWHNSPEAMAFFHIRVFAMLLFLGGMVLWVLTLGAFVYAIQLPGTARWRRTPVPALALLTFAAAGWMLTEYSFFPSV